MAQKAGLGGIDMQTVASLIALGGIVVAVHGVFQWRTLKKQGENTHKAKLMIPLGILGVIIGGALITTTPEYQKGLAEYESGTRQSQKADRSKKASSKQVTD
jgi:uncharacterized membrane protein YfcA